MTRPNLLLVITDDHAAHAVSAYGSVVNATPRIDEIGALGVRFDQCFATNSLCAPSRASILTGTYSHVNGVTTLDTYLDAAQPTFVTQLRDAGYRTAFVGKWHMGHHDGHDPQGFDYWDVFIDQGEYWDPRFLSAKGLRHETGYATDLVTNLSLRWLDSVDDGTAPWCIVVAHKAPHRPWEPHPAYADRYAGAIPVPATFTDDLQGRSDTARRAVMSVARDLTEEDLKQPVPPGLAEADEAVWKYQRYMEDYLACVASVDDNVGRLTDWLRERGRLEDTVLLYTSDQGFFLGDHGWFDKRFMYEQSIRMPLLLAYPRQVAPGGVHEGIVTNVDFARTLLEAAGVPAHPRMQGRSVWAELAGTSIDTTSPEGFYYRYWMHDDRSHHVGAHYGYRTDRYVLIYFYNDGLGLAGCSPETYPPEWELYDLATDPDELHNVAGSPAYAAVRADLEVRMWRAQAAVGDHPHPSQPRPARLT